LQFLWLVVKLYLKAGLNIFLEVIWMGSKEKRERELEKIWEFLDKENEIQYIEGSFRHYIDNKIDDNELDRTLHNR
jgi:hypothetical protein